MKSIPLPNSMYALVNNIKTRIRFLALACAFVGIATAPALGQKEIFGIGEESKDIHRIDLSSGAVTNLGPSGVLPRITNLAMSPGRVLYYMDPGEVSGGGHNLYSATLNGTNTALVGAPTLVKHLPTTGFGIIDGFTVGPDGKLYLTGYGKSEIYQYDIVNNVFKTTVHIVGGGQFRSDLAFDPISGNLIGLGIEPGSSDRTLFEIPSALALSTSDDAYTWMYYGGASSAWSTKKLNTNTELGESPDGIAFDPTNGDLYLSGDGTGIYKYDRITAVRGALVPLTGNVSLQGIGWDLAFQTRTVPLGFRCPKTQGYWKNHASAWPVTSLTLGNITYNQTQLLNILGLSSVGDASVILAKQLIAAKLNIANVSNPLPIVTTIQHADNLLIPAGNIPQHINTSSATGQAMVGDGSVLDKYNNGKLTSNCSERK